MRLILAMIALIPLVISFAGALHPAGDSFAVIRLPLAGLALILLIWARRPLWILLPGLALCGFALSSVFMLKMDKGANGPVWVYQKNIRYDNTETASLLADILTYSPDHITLQEVKPRQLKRVKAELGQVYPTQHWCTFPPAGGSMVLSIWPEIPGSAFCATHHDGISGVRVQTERGPVWVLSLHLHWPWPYGQAEHRARIMPLLEALEGPVIIGGDFNMVAWSHTLARIQAATDTQRAGAAQATFEVFGMPLGIDHVLAPGGGSIEVLPKLGSDHNGLLARIVVWPDL